MSQSTFDDDELFTEASSELREDVEEALEEARENLPDADEVLEVRGDNVIGVLNSLKGELDVEDADDALREARKWFETGRRAEAFDQGFVDETGEEIESLKEVLEAVDDASENATELVNAVATLKKHL